MSGEQTPAEEAETSKYIFAANPAKL